MKPEPTFLGWTWRAHFDDLHRLVVEDRWLDVAKSLSAMLAHALDKARREDFEVLIARSSIGAAIADIKARGIDAHLVDLEREMTPRWKREITKTKAVRK